MTTATLHASPRSGLVDLVGLLLTVLALLITYKLTRPPPVIPVTDLPAATCDLQRETCHLALPGGGALELRVAGRPVRPNQPFVIEARSENSTLHPLEVVIRGIEVDMSSTAKPFESDGQGGFRVETSLPICTVSRMTWEVSVTLEADGKHLRWPLFFVTEG